MASKTYLGPAGAVSLLPDPDRESIQVEPYRIGSTTRLLGSSLATQLVATKYRVSMAWSGITMNEYRLIERIVAGHAGPGPLLYVDPDRSNLLSMNQATSGDDAYSTAGFLPTRATVSVALTRAGSSAGVPALAKSGAQMVRLRSTAALAVNNDVMQYTDSSAFALATRRFDTPVIPGQKYSFGVNAQRLAAATAGSLTPWIRWYNAAGAFLSDSNGVATALAADTWTMLKVENATAPANAVWGRPGLLAGSAWAANAMDIYIDEAMWNIGATLAAWESGSGGMLVTPDTLSASYPRPGRVNASLTLLEV